MRLEVQHDLEPSLLWIVKIRKNVGGRLLLCYEGTEEEDTTADFWLFYLDHRLHPIGWAQQQGCIYKPPTGRFGNVSSFSSLVLYWGRLFVYVPTAQVTLPHCDLYQIFL